MEEMVAWASGTRMERLLSEMSDREATCLLASPENYKRTVLDTVKCIAEKPNMRGVFVSATMTFGQAVAKMEQAGVDMSRLSVIDFVMLGMLGGDNPPAKGDLPAPLLRLEREIEMTVAHSGANYVLFDSVDALFTFEDAESVERFFHEVLDNLRARGVLCIAVDQAGGTRWREESAARELFGVVKTDCLAR